mgnify:CR=1 FL=1
MSKRSFSRLLRQELIEGRSAFDWSFLGLGIAVQIVAFLWQPERPIAIVSGIAGIISVILCSQKKISTFFFGFIQISTYLYLCWVERLYGEVGINVFYFVAQIYGIYVWLKHYKLESNDSAELEPRKMSIRSFVLLLSVALLLSAVAGFMLERFTDDTQPWLDAFTTVPAVFAQIMMVLAYREQWIIWLLVDVLSAIMWVRAGNYCLLMQYVFWLMNCVYGYTKWSKKNIV